MKTSRVSLTEEDRFLIISALQARRASSGETRQHHIDRLIARLGENRRGNPKFIFDADSQEHEVYSR